MVELLPQVWFVLIGVLFVGYSLLDGFDLGIGCLLPYLAKTDEERRQLFNTVGPVWDGNEVWLLAGGGALFAAFPPVYATVFSGFYLALMLVLLALILRAVALEFHHGDPRRKGVWSYAFELGSAVPSVLFGVALGNVIAGLPLNLHGDFIGDFFTLLRPYPLAVGGLGLCAILLQGATFAALKTDGVVRERAQGIATWMSIPLLALLAVTGVMGHRLTPAVFTRWAAWLSCLGVVSGAMLALLASRRGQDAPAFAGSCLAFAGLWGIAGAVLYPDLVRSLGPGPALTVFNSAAGPKTLLAMTIVALVGVPLVLGYTVYAYRVFRGRTPVPAAPKPEEP